MTVCSRMLLGATLLTALCLNGVWAQSINTSGMSYELRRAVENFPVTLYTSTSCSPCDAGRALLHTRGVPFIEKTINTQEDIEALKSRKLGDQVPVLSVGSRSVKGYDSGVWETALNFARYPQTTQLPRNYSNPAASPLASVAAQTPAATETPAFNKPPASPQNTSPAPLTDTNNPAGIRF
jgi:glutaredoxin